jgi:hypothetical protein
MAMDSPIELYSLPGHDRDCAAAILNQARVGNHPLSDIQVVHLLAIGSRAGRAVSRPSISQPQFRKAMRLHDIADRVRNAIVRLLAGSAGAGSVLIAHAHPTLAGGAVAAAVGLAGLAVAVLTAAAVAAVIRRHADIVAARQVPNIPLEK